MQNGRGFYSRIGALIAIYLATVYLVPRPQSVAPEGWRLAGIFFATIGGLILQPIPGGGVVLIAVTLAAALGCLSIEEALSGYGDSTVWLVMAAFFISRALLNTGLARRVALIFVRAFGRSSVGVCYALGATDMVLASIIPSNAARSGGVTLPIARSIAELYGSSPGPTARLLGAYLMASIYQSVCITSTMFFTGQASNPLAARMAAGFGAQVTWTNWFVAALIPGLLSLILIPRVVFAIYPPDIRATPRAAEFAARELEQTGPMKLSEKILTGVFLGICGLWITSAWHSVSITVTALLGSGVLLLTGVLNWEDVRSEKAAWDIFLWYGGLIRLGKAMGDAGVTKVLATSVGGVFSEAPWPLLLAIALLFYFYAHYAFASITAHLLAMYPAFVTLLTLKGAPLYLVVFSFAFFSNLSAGLTHYGTTPAPMYFAQGYVTLKEWWRIGAVAALANIAIWTTSGLLWWKLLRLW